MTRQPANIASLFSAELLRRLQGEHCDGRTAPVAATIRAHLHDERPLLDESSQYFALCERAWLRWTRFALDYIASRALRQATAGTFTPAHIADANDAARAQSRCVVHIKLLDHASKRLDHDKWPWQLEAARHVHDSTRHALGHAARLDGDAAADASALYPGLLHAADALAVTINAGFVRDGEREVRETLWAVRSRGYAAPDGRSPKVPVS
jgi:hypothetical protein